ncbi:MAG: DUF2279 domain-containing protein [Candidatus Kryptonium sp.]|nr:YfiM family protein [Candidatus Kryptonium sp.]MCX7763226.1 YfiM family protein [Candidatus Kryptonium sp.]MDW8109160.1 DUF2279 domain-containing protein [Candidatus Kryptonium sp.]
MQVKILKIFLLLVFCFGEVFPFGNYFSADDSISKPVGEKINYTKLAIVGLGTVGVMGVIHVYQQNAWWSGQRRSFHVVNDWDYALNIDKIGHFYGANLISNLFASSLQWAGVEKKKSMIYGAVLGSVFGLYVEFEDGFATQWGFSPGDAGANILGAWYPIAQHYVPFLKNFNFKWSYIPTSQLRSGKKKIFIDDHEGQVMWLSISVNNFLPKEIEKFYPDFLNIAIGYGVRELDGLGGGKREFYISLDYDLEKLPGDGWFLKLLKKNLNYIHLPAPAVRLTPSFAFFGFFFSKRI